MSIPGYDDWKLMTPEEDRERSRSPCPWCGADSPRQCEMEEEIGACPWEDSEPDPDYLRDLRAEP